MELAHAGDEELLRLGIVVVMQRRVLLSHAVQRRGDLVLVAAALGLDGEGDGGLGKGDGGQDDGLAFIAERVARQGVLELGDHADLPGAERLHGLLGLAHEMAEMPDALLPPARGVEHLAVRLEGAGVDAEEGQLAHVRIRDGLEDDRGERRLGVPGARDGLLRSGIGALHRAQVGGRGKLLDDEVHEGLDAQALGGGGGEDGHEGSRSDGLAERSEHLLLADAALLEVLGEEVVVRFRHRLDELLPPRLRVVHDLAGDVRLLHLAVGGDEGLHGHEIDDAGKAGLRSHGDLERAQASLEALLEGLEGAEEVGALAVETVDHDGPGQPVLVGVLPDLLRLHLHAGHRIHDDDGRARRAQSRPRVGHEVAVSGGVDQVEAVALPVAEGDGGAERDLALDLVGVEVGGGGAVIDLAEPVDGAGREEDAFHQRCLADSAVPREAHVANLRDVRRHACLPSAPSRRETSTAGERTM